MDSNPEFKIVVAYETFANAVTARGMSERIAAESQLEGEVDCDFWQFELLGHPELRAQALREASEADMIIIATGDARELPVQVQRWIQNWMPVRREAPTALVSLLDAPGKASDEAPPVCEYLRRIANENGMDFFCNAGDWWQFDLEPARKTPNLEHSFSHPGYREYEHIGTGWGIND